jgi:putative Ig domain-containing protein
MDHARAQLVIACMALALLFPSASPADQGPVVSAPSVFEAAEEDSVHFTVTASDPDGDPITGLGALDLPARAVFDVDLPARRGTFRWLPNFDEAGTYTVAFFAENAIRGLVYTSIWVDNTDRPPIVSAPGDVSGTEGEALDIIGATATDPDGEPIESFTAEGLPPGATFTTNRTFTSLRIFWTPVSGQAGVYPVTLTAVSRPGVDAPLAASAVVTISIAPGSFPARAFVLDDEKVIRLASAGKACIHIETVGNAFDVGRVDPSQVTLSRPGFPSSISGMEGSVVPEDRDGNGIADVTVCFAKDDLRRLFADFQGFQIRASVSGVLTGGSTFGTIVDLKILTAGGPVFVCSNPSRSSPALSFTTYSSGRVRLDLFDSRGRLVRTILHESQWPSGFHDVAIEGDHRKLPAGVYYFKLETTEGVHRGKVVILK